MAAAANDPGAASGVLAPPSCGVPEGTPRRSLLRFPLSLPGSFASLVMITPTDSWAARGRDDPAPADRSGPLVRGAGARPDRRLLPPAGGGLARPLVHGLRHLRHRGRAPSAPGRRGQLCRAPPRPALLDGAPEHALLRPGRRPALARRLARRGARGERQAGALPRPLPDGLLPARGDHAGRGRGRLALPLPSPLRPPEPGPRARRARPDRLARRSRLGHARHHPARGVQKLRLQHDHLRRRPPERPRAALRGGPDRRRGRLAAVPPRHPADARAHLRLRRRGHDDRLLPTLRRAVRHDPGRAGGQHAQRRAAHVRGGLPLVEHGPRRGDRLRALRHHPRVHGLATRAASVKVQRGADGGTGGAAGGGGGRMRRAAEAVLLHAALVAGAVLTLVPLLWMVSASLMPAGEATAVPPRLLPSAVTLAHYRALFTRLDLARAVLNSAGLAAAVTLIALFVNSLAGYALATPRLPGRERLFRLLLAGLVVPAQVAMLPLFLMLKELRLVNTYAGVMVPGMASVFGIFLVRQYALSLPESVLDAARIDGAGEFRIYRSLVLYLCAPILVTLAVLTFMGTWNDFMWPLVVLADARLYTLPVALASLAGEHVQDVELMMAGAVLTVLPVVLLFVCLQRYYIAGIMAGGVKE